ncbi:MAG: 4'-phosphopantetheinyl transferase superfamily protein [Flavobacteriales bacterium]|nr:4'-phosphopantetheinyl transferase superfamily protein [Flavobacteriales bacterium]
MPLSYYRSHDSCEVALWSIEEDIEFFRSALLREQFPISKGEDINHPEQAIQWFASRFLLLQSHPAAIDFYINRKPHLYNGPKISFSHSGKTVGVLLSKHDSGLDIQYFDEKLKRIKPKFTTNKETGLIRTGSKIASLSLIWSVKEAIFKLYGTGVPFLSINIVSYDPIRKIAIAKLERGKSMITHSVQAHFIGDMSLAYVLE